MIKIMHHDHYTKRLHVVGVHVTIILDCTLQLFCTERRIKEIKMAQRLASGIEPET